MALICCGHAYATPKFDAETSDDKTVTISNVFYDYTMIYQEGQLPDCIGSISFDVSFPPGASRIIVARTHYHLLTYDNPFYSLRFSIDVDDKAKVEHVTFPKTRWGSFIRVNVIYEDSDNLLSPHINSLDYISEADKSIILGSLDSPQISDDCQDIRITSDGMLTLDSYDSGDLWIYTLNGQCIMADHFNGGTTVPLPESSSSMLILKVKFDNNRIITRKINR